MAPTDTIERSGRYAWPDARVAGVDEAGRGPLAGPVVAAAVVLDPMNFPNGLDDSKALSAPERERLAARIVDLAPAIAIADVPATLIDRLNIRMASLLAMKRAVLALAVPPERILVDGRDDVPGLHMPCEAIVGGDARSVSIAAASIIAKVTRDRMMGRAAERWPNYGFEGHKGYPTPSHRAAIEAYGPCLLHRRTFGSVKARSQREGPDRGCLQRP